jgi:hypothetical protein
MEVTPREVKGMKSSTWSKEIRELHKKLRMNSFQEAVLIGTLLGDGSLVANAYGKNYRLRIEHQKAQKEYVEWKYHVFKEWCLSKPKFRIKTNSWYFRTISHPVFTRYRNLFYQEGRKIVPKRIDLLLRDPISLAVWFMDDGGIQADKRNPSISTHSFTKRENLLLRKVLWQNFGIETNLNWDGKGNRLYIPKRSLKRFVSLISPYILPSMKYKIPLTP